VCFVMSPGIAGVHPSLNSTGTVASKRAGLKDTIGSATGETVEQVSMSFPVYEDTKLFIERDIMMKWQEINDTFSGTFEEDLEDVGSMSTSTNLAYTKLHASISHFHART